MFLPADRWQTFLGHPTPVMARRSVIRRNNRGRWAFLLLQVPDILLAGLILWLAHRWAGLPLGWAFGLFGLWLVKDVAMVLLLGDLFTPPRIGPEALAGARAVVQERLAPRGHVRLGSELWQAECLPAWETIPPGTPVIVRAARGLTLLVEAEGSAPSPGGKGRSDEGAAGQPG
jgi:membrane protein implicated in regulation of membrane protease activity